jgi:hypothetical protein
VYFRGFYNKRVISFSAPKTKGFFRSAFFYGERSIAAVLNGV